MFSRTLHAQHPVTMNFNTSPRFSPTIFYRDANSVPTSTPFYSSINRLYAQNPVFEIVREESLKIYLHMHNGNVQQNPLCVESCVTNGFPISPRLSPTMFDPDANSVLLRAHLCTAVDFMCRKACVRNSSRERKGLYNGNALLTRLYTAAVLIGSMRRTLCSKLFMVVFSIFPRFSTTIFYRDANSVLLQILVHICTAVLIGSMREPCV